MKYVRVTVNDGEYKGKTGKVVGYDRNKYYTVKFDDGEVELFKSYYLDGINKMYGNKRYNLQYGKDEPILNTKELMADRHEHINKGRGNNKRFRYFSITIENEDYRDLYFSELLSKVRHAMQNKKRFFVVVDTHTKTSSSYVYTLSYYPDTDIINTTSMSKCEKKYYDAINRKIIKVINKY